MRRSQKYSGNQIPAPMTTSKYGNSKTVKFDANTYRELTPEQQRGFDRLARLVPGATAAIENGNLAMAAEYCRTKGIPFVDFVFACEVYGVCHTVDYLSYSLELAD